MKIRVIPFFTVLFFLFSVSAAPADSTRPLSLSECYALALKRSETVAVSAENIVQARARFVQALGTVLPHAAFSVVETWQENPSAASSLSSTGSESFFSGNSRVSLRNFVFTQTLFSGFREFAAMRGSRLERAQRAGELTRAKQLLFADVADAFYLLLEQREDLKIMESVRASLRQRIGEIQRREDIGRSRPSERASTEVQLYSLEAEMEQVRSQEKVAKDLLEYLIGRPVGTLVDGPGNVPGLESEASYAARAGARPDVLAQESAVGVARENAAVARADLWPTINAEHDLFTRRTSLPGSDWSTILRVNIPIFEGTTTYGQIMQADSGTRQARLQASLVLRRAEQEIRDAYWRVAQAVRRRDALERSFKAAWSNYDLQRGDYESNLVSNLDVLAALQSLADAQRSYAFSVSESKRLYRQLLVAVGEPPEEAR